MKKQCPLKYLGLAAAVVALSGFARADGGFLAVKGGTFVDAAGREVILHGVNIVDKSKAHGYLSWHGPEEFAKMRDWGFNCIRLVIIWDGVEPEPGTYDDEYLAGVDKRIQWAKENGMYVLLDMHQDLFSAKFGADGAPLWACLDEDKPHVRGGRIWSDTYFSSPALHAAFDNFWANTPGPDGVGIQDHFALAWQHVAERYADEPAVVGYDLFNEPFIGSRVLDALPQMLAAFATAVAKKQGGAAPVIGDLMRQLTNPGAGTDLRKHLEDMEVFTSLVDSDASLFQEFERTELASMYNRVAEAIRKVDRRHLLLRIGRTTGARASRTLRTSLRSCDPTLRPSQALCSAAGQTLPVANSVAPGKRIPPLPRPAVSISPRSGFPTGTVWTLNRAATAGRSSRPQPRAAAGTW